MSKFKDIQSCFKEIESRYNNTEKIKRKLANYNEPIKVTFLDTGRSFIIFIKGDKGIAIENSPRNEETPVKIEFTAERILINLFNKEIGAIKAYSTGQIKIVEGKIRNLLKLKSLLF